MIAAETSAPRLDWERFYKTAPEFVSAMRAITNAFKDSKIEAELREMLKVRASQLNGCAFCVQFHLNDARKLGIAPEKLDLLATWREAGIYSEREQAALEWTERVTLLAQQHIDDVTYERIEAHFPGDQMTLLTVAISQINAWNRVAAPFRFTPPIPRAE